MKKLVVMMLLMTILVGLVGCGKKSELAEAIEAIEKVAEAEENIDTSEEIEATEAATEAEEDTDTSEEIVGDPAEYTMEYWAAKYPGDNICPFYIDENGVERNYFLIMSMGCTMKEWVESPFNWNGWHVVGDAIVNEDETLKMTDDWGLDESGMFSSFCVVTTEPYEAQE